MLMILLVKSVNFGKRKNSEKNKGEYTEANGKVRKVVCQIECEAERIRFANVSGKLRKVA